MRAAQERGQEFLPPKKRDLPPAAPTTTSTEELRTAAEKEDPPADWSQAPPSPASSPWSSGVQAGLTLDQFGLLYKVSAFPSPPPPAVLSLGAVPPTSSASSAFGGMASPFLQTPGAPFPQVHFAQLPPAPLQFLGGPFPLPYAPQGFLPGHLLPTTAGLQAPPHLVPFVPLLQEDPGPRSVQAAFGNKAQSRIPVYYQVSHLPPGYAAFEAPVASLGPEPALRESHLSPEGATENGLHVQEGEAKGRWPPAALHCGTNGPTSVVLSPPPVAGRPGASQRSSPEADLEVQQVVGVLAFQGHSGASAPERDDPSPLNLSHSSHGEKVDSAKNLSGVALTAAADRRPSEQEQEQKQVCPRQVLAESAVANGKLGPFRPAAHNCVPESPSPEVVAAECAPRSQGHLPSHFMKGAIIQLATGELKRVEDLQTQDFVRSAEASGGLKIDSSTVVDIRESAWPGLVTLHFVVGEQQSKVSIDVPPEHPFFVYGQGWSSCSPERTARLFALRCHGLQVGDVCVSISLQGLNGRPASLASPEVGERPGCSRQGVLREPPGVPTAERSPPELAGVGRGSSPEISQLSPVVSALGWAGPGLQRLGEESLGPPLLRPSFIPQEVKLSIEGRSNAGK